MGVHTEREERKWKEQQQDFLVKARMLELVKIHGAPNETMMPWNTAQKYFLWIKYNNPDMEVL